MNRFLGIAALGILLLGGLEAAGIWLLTDDAPAAAKSTPATATAQGPAKLREAVPAGLASHPAAQPPGAGVPPQSAAGGDEVGLAAFQFSPDPGARAAELSAIRAERLRVRMDQLNARAAQAAAERAGR